MTLQRHHVTGRLLRAPSGKLARSPDCCCFDSDGCECCKGGTWIENAVVTVSGASNLTACPDCTDINGDWSFPMEFSCNPVPFSGGAFKDCAWNGGDGYSGAWCNLPPLGFGDYLWVGCAVYFDDVNDELEVEVTVVNSITPGVWYQRWDWQRTAAAINPFDCISAANAIDTSGESDLYIWDGGSEICGDTVRVSVVFS